jgi:DNA-binding NtrC family response regulator
MQEGIASIVTVVDDDPSIRESLAAVLKSAGYWPKVFASAEEAIRSDYLKISSCLLTDINMPGMGGWALHQHAITAHPDLSIIVMTGNPVAEPSDPDTELPMILYKPIRVVDLLAAIATSLSKDLQTGGGSSTPIVLSDSRVPTYTK